MQFLNNLIQKITTSTSPVVETKQEEPKVYASELSERICSLLMNPTTYERQTTTDNCNEKVFVIKFKNTELYISPYAYGNFVELMELDSGKKFLKTIETTSAEEKDIRDLARPIIDGYIEEEKQTLENKKIAKLQAKHQSVLSNLNDLNQQVKINAKKEEMKSKMKQEFGG